jgi:hypothetical protein
MVELIEEGNKLDELANKPTTSLKMFDAFKYTKRTRKENPL